MPTKREISKKEIQYSQRMDILFSDKEFTDTVLCLVSALDQYLLSAERLQIDMDSSDSYQMMTDFAILCLEVSLNFDFSFRN